MEWWIWLASGGAVVGFVSVSAACAYSCLKQSERAFTHSFNAESLRDECESHRDFVANQTERVEAMIAEFEARTAATIPGRVSGSSTPHDDDFPQIGHDAEVPEIDQQASNGPFGDGQGCP